MKRLVDLLLATGLLGGAGYGAYLLGRHIDFLSNRASSKDPELNGTTTLGAAAHSAKHAQKIAGLHVTPLQVGTIVLVVLLAFVTLSLLKALVKGRKRQRWHLSS